MSVTYQLGLPDHLRAEAAELYWQAFGNKLGRVMGPKPKAQRFLLRVLRADHVVIALDDHGALLGMAGFKTPAGSFAGGDVADMLAIYGRLGAAWRLPLLWALGREVDNARFLLDGICVTKAARSQGIGATLMTIIEAEARQRGYQAVRLDVVDGNWRAKALYQRLGYKPEKTDDIGVLRYAFGFQSSTTMVKSLP